VPSSKAGTTSTPILLRKVGNESRKNRLYQALRELGRVVRTAFLLRNITDLHLRDRIPGGTNKVEAYNGFYRFCSIDGDGVIAENDPEEQEKRVATLDNVATSASMRPVSEENILLDKFCFR
jgi:TnpA family transposase